MPNSKFGVTLDNVWADYRRCARRSRALKTKLDGVRMSALVLVTLSGVLGLLSTQLPESLNPARIFSFASALAAAMGGYISAQALSFGWSASGSSPAASPKRSNPRRISIYRECHRTPRHSRSRTTRHRASGRVSIATASRSVRF